MLDCHCVTGLFLCFFLFMVTIKRCYYEKKFQVSKKKTLKFFVAVMFAWISERVVRVQMCVFFAISYPTNKFDGSNYFLLFSLVSLSVRHSSSYSMDLRIIF